MPPTPNKHKSVTFCNHCQYTKTYSRHDDHDIRYYSDPGQPEDKKKTIKEKPRKDSTLNQNKSEGYYSEPDAKYFEIDYEFLKELRKIARRHCPKCKRKRSKRAESNSNQTVRSKEKRSTRKLKENFVYCNGRYHSEIEHCQLCCKICNRSTETLDSTDNDVYSLVSRSYSLPSTKVTASKSTQRKRRERKNSIQSIKSVSFLDSNTNESRKDEPNYTAKSFTNDLKQFLLKPTTPRLSLRDKFIISFKQEFEAKKKSPKLKAIKGLWKSY